MYPLVSYVSVAVTLGDNHTDESAVVLCFLVGFVYPLGEGLLGDVFHFRYHFLVVASSDTSDVSTVKRSSHGPSLDPVVDMLGHVVGDVLLELGASSLC